MLVWPVKELDLLQVQSSRADVWFCEMHLFCALDPPPLIKGFCKPRLTVVGYDMSQQRSFHIGSLWYVILVIVLPESFKDPEMVKCCDIPHQCPGTLACTDSKGCFMHVFFCDEQWFSFNHVSLYLTQCIMQGRNAKHANICNKSQT